MCTAGTYGFVICATSEIPHATKRPSDSSEPGTKPRACGENTPHTWLKLTPTFSKTLPRIRRECPPPCSRCPSGLLHERCSKRPPVSNCSNAEQMRPCRSRKYSPAGAAMSRVAGAGPTPKDELFADTVTFLWCCFRGRNQLDGPRHQGWFPARSRGPG